MNFDFEHSVVDTTSYDEFLLNAGELLRVLSQTTQPWSVHPLEASTLFLSTQIEFLDNFLPRFHAILNSPRSSMFAFADDLSDRTWKRLVVMMTRMIHFIIAFAPSWPIHVKTMLGNTKATLFKTMMASSRLSETIGITLLKN